MAEPFLTEDGCARNTNRTLELHHFLQNASDHQAAARLEPASTYGEEAEGQGLSSVSYAFWIMALINVSSQRIKLRPPPPPSESLRSEAAPCSAGRPHADVPAEAAALLQEGSRSAGPALQQTPLP